MRVTLDPGHGGRDPGAIGPTGLQEKVVCLNVGLLVRDLLEGQADVRLTRETDIRVPLGQRIASPGAACFISIHCNSHINRTSNGTETFYFAMGHNKSKALSEIMQRHMIAEMRLRDRGVKTGRFQVIRQALVPASLVELAFISNPLEEAMLGSTEGQARAARALAEGIREFLQVRLHVPQDQI